jgi:prepilin peptidase dependent protein B
MGILTMKKQTGFTLIEIMIALTLGLIVVGATIAIYIATVGSSSSTIRSARLNHDLEAIMSLMINDIRRAGYWGGALMYEPGAIAPENPFTAATTNLQIPSSSCIVYSYDANGDGQATPNDTTDDVDGDEFYGFKKDGNTIRMRKTGSTTANCTDGTWEEFIDGNRIKITNLTFSFAPITSPNLPGTSRCLNVDDDNATNASTSAPTTAPCSLSGAADSGEHLAEKRILNIILSGESDGATKSLNGTVEVRNLHIFTQP